MKRFGVSANLMSLGALDFGLIVDASVVMVENFMRRIEGRDDLSPAARSDLLREAAFEVGRPIVFGVAIIVAVYVPVFTLEGLEGRMFRPMAFTVCAAVLGSLLLALTYIPAASSLVLAATKTKFDGSLRPHEEPTWFLALRSRYARSLTWAIAHRRAVVGTALAVLAVALGSVPFLGSEFMPKLDEGTLLIETRRIPSTSLPQGISVSEEVERTLRKLPEVSGVVTNLGRPHEPTETMALYQGDVYVGLKPKREWQARSLDQLIEKWIKRLVRFPVSTTSSAHRCECGSMK